MMKIIIEIIDCLSVFFGMITLFILSLAILSRLGVFDWMKEAKKNGKLREELAILKQENEILAKRLERVVDAEEPEKKYGTVDTFSMVYCVFSVFVIMIVLTVCSWLDCPWWQLILILLAPFIIDLAIKTGIFTYLLLKKIWLKIKKYFYNKKNPPKVF